MNRVFLDLAIKATQDDQRVIEGWATTPTEDRMGDIVMPRGASYKLPLPLLIDHNHSLAVGNVERVEVSDAGIKFTARIAKIAEPGEAKNLVDKAWQLVKNGLRRSVSIGFRPLDHEPLAAGGKRFKKWEWLELSLVAVPAQADAAITSAKAANGFTIRRIIRDKPAASGRYSGLTPAERREMAEVKAAYEQMFGWED
ncbi:HK97 family phage prohead protease [Sphingobium estronivorans]|uniref:HK97 family phage prohead protease n=1 Tax=Sphingobium estronivorans TaxID=1577690 RepID=UPI0012392796|nr:HK97 family phage prohead protease [Sphingobium estronivorans]